MSEFNIIRDYFDWQPRPADLTLGIGDDAALVSIPVGMELVVSVDTSNAGIHFPLDTPPHAIGYKSLAVNLSDLAAMGAIPKWFTLAISLPEANPIWLSEFARGLRELAEQHQIYLIGGDTTRGALSITIQVMGLVEQGTALLRSRAQVDDLICVSGTLGDAAAGLAVVQQRLELADIQAIRSNLAKQNFEIKKEADINVIDLLGKASMADLQADSATAKAWGQFGSSLLSTGVDVVAKRELYSLKMDK